MIKAFVAILLVTGALWSGDSKAQVTGDGASTEEGPAVDLTLDLNSAYVWRGITLNDGWVAQPSLNLEGLHIGPVPISLNVWSNFNHGDFDGTLKKDSFSEVDLTLSAELGAGFSVGFIQYIFMNTPPSEEDEPPSPGTGELSLSWTGPWEAITPTATLYYDVEEVDGAFFSVALSHSFELSEKTLLDLAVECGAASDAFAEYYTGSEGGLYHYAASLKLAYQATERFGLGLSVGYTDHFKESVLPGQPVGFFGGFSLVCSF